MILKKIWPYLLAQFMLWTGVSLVLITMNIDIRNWQWWAILAGYLVYGWLFAAQVDAADK